MLVVQNEESGDSGELQTPAERELELLRTELARSEAHIAKLEQDNLALSRAVEPADTQTPAHAAALRASEVHVRDLEGQIAEVERQVRERGAADVVLLEHRELSKQLKAARSEHEHLAPKLPEPKARAITNAERSELDALERAYTNATSEVQRSGGQNLHALAKFREAGVRLKTFKRKLFGTSK